jgi:LysR substrate binding domain
VPAPPDPAAPPPPDPEPPAPLVPAEPLVVELPVAVVPLVAVPVVPVPVLAEPVVLDEALVDMEPPRPAVPPDCVLPSSPPHATKETTKRATADAMEERCDLMLWNLPGVISCARVPRTRAHGSRRPPNGLAPHAENLELSATSFAMAAAGREVRAEGEVRVTAPPGIAEHLLAPALKRLLGRWPKLRVTLASVGRADLTRREADLALRSFLPRRAIS